MIFPWVPINVGGESAQNASSYTILRPNLPISLPTLCILYDSYLVDAGFGFESGWTLIWPPWSTVRCPAWLRLTWPLTVSCRLKIMVSCLLPTRGLVSSGGPTTTVETDISRLPAQSCGTTFQLVSGKMDVA